MNAQEMLNQLMNDPKTAAENAKYQIPESLYGNPQAMVMHLINSGQVAPPLLQKVMPFVRQLMGK